MWLNLPAWGHGGPSPPFLPFPHFPAFHMGPTTPVRVRLSLAIAVSVALHAAIILTVHPSRGVSRPQGFAFTARLAPADEGRDQKAAPLDPGASAPAPAPPAEEARIAGPPQNPAVLSPPARPDFSAAAAAQTRTQSDAAGGVLPAQRYYLASELERPPSPLQTVEPENPVESGSREGIVVLRLLINERGSVDEVTVVRAEPSGVFEKSALAAFGGARFSPGMLSGAAVKSQLLVEVQYRLDARAVSGRGY